MTPVENHTKTMGVYLLKRLLIDNYVHQNGHVDIVAATTFAKIFIGSSHVLSLSSEGFIIFYRSLVTFKNMFQKITIIVSPF